MSNEKMKDSAHKDISLQKDRNENQYPLLQAMRGTNPFTVPDGYFERLAGDIMNKISSQEKPEKNVIRTVMAWRWPYKLALAASLIFMAFIVSYLVMKPQTAQQLISELQQITASELMDYDGYLVDLDESLLEEWIDQKGDGIDSAILSLASMDQLTGDDIMEYLISEYSPDELTIEEP